MPASFEILPPETLSGAADAADARPPSPQRETKFDDAHPGPQQQTTARVGMYGAL